MSERCELCGREPLKLSKSSARAFEAVIDRAGLEWRPVALLAARVAEATGCAPSTVENLLRVARAARILDSRKLHFGGRKVLHVRKRKDPIAVACEAREWAEHVGRQG